MNHTLNFNYTSPSGAVTAAIIASGSQNLEIDAPIAEGAANFEIDFDVPVAPEAKGFLFIADQAMTVKTNSTSAPDNTITLTANVPYFWVTGMGANPLAAAITKVYVTSANAGTLKIRAVFNTVPNNA